VPNTEIIKEWVAALRSGEYEQGQGTLKQVREFNNAKGEYGDWEELEKPRFCCLGVLCDLAEQEGITKAAVPAGGSTAAYEEMQGLPPESVENWAGIKEWEVAWPGEIPPLSVEPECAPGCEMCADMNLPPAKRIGLASLNDNQGWNFNQIADAIEKEWLVDA
jgi:hypothetical protein